MSFQNQMSHSNLQPRKAELMCAHSKMRLPWVFTHNNKGYTCSYKNQPYGSDIYESIQLVLSIKQVGTGSDLNGPTPNVQKVFLFFFFASLLKHSMNSIEIPLSIFSLEITTMSKSSINNYLVCSACSTSFGLKRLFLWQPKFQPPKCISCFSHSYISLDKYHQTPILFMAVLFSKWPL